MYIYYKYINIKNQAIIFAAADSLNYTAVMLMNPEFSEFYRILGLNIAYYRNLRGLSQEQLGEKLDIEQPHVSKIERAAIGISMDMLCAIAAALDVEPYLLLKPKE